jgi:hypothetical protein
MGWNSIVFHRNSHTCRSVIAVLATVNEPETELFVMVFTPY